MGTELISNYEKMKNEMAGAFLKYDQEAVIRKFDLKYDKAYLYLDLLNRAHRISRKTGQVTWSEDGFQTESPADYNAAMTIYDVLCYSRKDCRPLPRLREPWRGKAGEGRRRL